MINKNDISNAYFEWMRELVCKNRFGDNISFDKLLRYLYDTEFTYSIRKDGSRADDGINLRYRFPYELDGIEDIGRYLDGPCNMLEMMLSLAIRCEETIMNNPLYGDRTSQWFWGMITSLGLGSMEDSNFDQDYIEFVIHRFLKRKYEPNGKGGLFIIRGCEKDLRKVDIWCQMCWFLDTIDPSVGYMP